MEDVWLYVKHNEAKNGLFALKFAEEKLAQFGVEHRGMTISSEDRTGWWIKYNVISRRVDKEVLSYGDSVAFQEKKKEA